VGGQGEQEQQPLIGACGQAHQGFGVAAAGSTGQGRRRRQGGIGARPSSLASAEMVQAAGLDRLLQPEQVAIKQVWWRGGHRQSPAHLEGRGHPAVQQHGDRPGDLVDEDIDGAPLHLQAPMILIQRGWI